MTKFLTTKLVSTGLIAIVTVLTIATSAMGMAKVARSFEDVKPKVPEIQQQKENETGKSKETTTGSFSSLVERSSTNKTPEKESKETSRPMDPTPVKSNTNVSATSNVGSQGTNVLGTSVTPTVASQSSTSTSTGCIITLFGKQYDVTKLTSTHSGGNVFKCGTDMTTVYQGQHGTNLSRMAPYLVTTGNTGSTATAGSSGTGQGSGAATGTNVTSGTSVSSSEHEQESDDHNEVRNTEDSKHDESGKLGIDD